MGEWRLSERDLKKYPHFDPLISACEAEALATDPDRVASHAFYPFMLYTQRWTRFAKQGLKGKHKKRLIRYAARRDAYIFSYYRHILSERYEAELQRLGLGASVLAYRRIPADGGQGGKCNIHFARDAFLKIQEFRDCCVIALDISNFFESLEHARLKALWCRMLGVEKLPPDHFHVYETITKYAVVDKEDVYERLGHFGAKRKTRLGQPIRGYLTPYNDVPKKLCNGETFREKVAGKVVTTSIIKKHHKPYGIPQGAPISDLLANLYLIDFDHTVAGWVREAGGAYYRYSDDILIIIPGEESVGRDLTERVRSLMPSFGAKLKIKEEKSSLVVFQRHGDNQIAHLVCAPQGQKIGSQKGIEYLGFRYDGRLVYLRDSTLANLYRKVVRAARRDAIACARRYPDKDAVQLRPLFNYERLTKKFGKVEDFNEKQSDYRNWTFWTYASRAAENFGLLGRPILRQLRNYRAFIRHRVDLELHLAVVRRGKGKTD